MSYNLKFFKYNFLHFKRVLKTLKPFKYDFIHLKCLTLSIVAALASFP
jgi:hypothetical protein